MNLNRVTLAGRLTRDVELRHINNGTAVAELGVAINRRSKTAAGEVRQEVTFVDVTSWGRTAEACNQYLSKDSGVLIEGRLQLDIWQTQDGQKRSKLKVVAESVQFGERSAARAHRDDAGEAATGTQNRSMIRRCRSDGTADVLPSGLSRVSAPDSLADPAPWRLE